MNTTRTRFITTAGLLVAVAMFGSPGVAGQAKAGQAAKPAATMSSERTFKVKLDFNRWHDTAELYASMKTLEKAYPKFLKYISIGKSYGGRDIVAMIINNPDTGADTTKPAMYIEANIHGNEVQGGEVCLYTIWYLMEHYGKIDKITQLVDERAFYILPIVNPDGRDYFMHGTGAGARTGHVPVDEDGDGLLDEDGPDDLNGNGTIEQIRKYVPGEGTHRPNARDPRIMEPVGPGQRGDWVLLGQEGIDNDGDGRVNEDGPGGYDPNRNFAADWQPTYIQNGAMDYPFQLPESRAVNDFLMARPNIAGVQTYHNTGGMILRSPGAEQTGEYPRADVAVYDELGRNGERMLPFYRYIIIWSGLYTVHGGVTDWTNDGLGIVSFSNELWNGGQYFTSPEL
ncbi:MAG: M14 family metallopeptidase, partial [Vicinamibacterales bacterium]|nr:M14 family metallopeptidase [Vicinamibacterales bacterium]